MDIEGHEKRFKKWKADIPLNNDGTYDKDSKYLEDGLTKENTDILIEFIIDMEIGLNVSNRNKKGGRSYPRLNTLRQKLSQMFKMLQERGVSNILKIKENEITLFFNEMKNGSIKTQKGEKYKSSQDYVKIFKSFYSWFVKRSRKEGKVILNICEDLDSSPEQKAGFVWITKEELNQILPYFDKDEQVILMFCFDSLVRSPSELLALKVRDIYEEEGEVWVNVEEETSKTFGRKFNLLFCGDELLKYIERNKLKQDDYLFQIKHRELNQKLQLVCKKIFGERVSKARKKYNEIILYDLRHSGSIHLRILASKNGKISLDAIRQRGGWTNFKMLSYYTEMLGLTGFIKKTDIKIEEDKTKLEKEINFLKDKMEKMKDEHFKDSARLEYQLAQFENVLDELRDLKYKDIQEKPYKVIKKK